MRKSEKANNSSKNPHKKNRTKLERERHLAAIAAFERLYPTKYTNLDLFAENVAKQLKISVSMAKKDIQEVRKRRRKAAEIDQAYELGKKIEELAAVKEMALATNNMNVYLGAINKECELLGLDKLSIFVGTKEDMELSVALKIQEFSDKLTPTDEIKTEKESEDNEIPDTGGGKE